MSDLKGREFYELWLLATAPGRPPSMDVAPWPSLTISEQNEWKLLASIHRATRFTAEERKAMEYLMNVPDKGQTIWSSDKGTITSAKASRIIRAMLDGEKEAT